MQLMLQILIMKVLGRNGQYVIKDVDLEKKRENVIMGIKSVKVQMVYIKQQSTKIVIMVYVEIIVYLNVKKWKK